MGCLPHLAVQDLAETITDMNERVAVASEVRNALRKTMRPRDLCCLNVW